MRVIVIGAGVAGLMAAVTLAEAGHRVTVLEGSDHVGGRVRTAHVDGMPVELGAEFVHGRPPELLALLDDLALDHFELAGEDLSFDASGLQSVRNDDPHAEDDDAGGDPFSVLDSVEQWVDAHPGQDLPFAEWVGQNGIDAEQAAAATAYVEGFNAADATEISVQSLAVQQRAEDEIDGSTSFHVTAGYDALPHALAERLQLAGGELVPRKRVDRIVWGRHACECVCADGERFHAERVVVAVPLPVLQNGSLRFEPAPGSVLQQAARMRMGQVYRLSLVFARRWWADLPHPQHQRLQRLSFLFGRGQLNTSAHFRVFWTGFPSADPVLTAWVGGPRSQQLSTLPDSTVAKLACEELAYIFGVNVETIEADLVSHHRYDWQNDPLFCGAYSWVPAGAVDASAAMTEPVEQTLFFAGEHTDTTGHWGTVHGALRSGMRVARQVMRL